MYLFLGISITLAALLIVNLVAATVASAAWSVLSRPARSLSARACARLIFVLRVGPLAAALIFAYAFIVPAYLIHEPENSGEIVSLKLGIIAAISSIGVIWALHRVLSAHRATRDLASKWQTRACPVEVEGVSIPVFAIEHSFPVVALVGFIRPRLFIARQVFSGLRPDELNAAIAHEYGHMKSRDNLKRNILRICRDLLIIPIGTDLDRAWSKNAESAADECAALSATGRALDLASALISLARMAPRHSPSLAGASALFDEQTVDVTERVHRLLTFAERGIVTNPGFYLSAPVWFWPAALTGLLILNFADQRLLLTTHDAIERFVRIIQ